MIELTLRLHPSSLINFHFYLSLGRVVDLSHVSFAWLLSQFINLVDLYLDTDSVTGVHPPSSVKVEKSNFANFAFSSESNIHRTI